MKYTQNFGWSLEWYYFGVTELGERILVRNFV